MNNQLTAPQAPVTDEELDQMIWKLERDGMTPKMLSLMRELREVRRVNGDGRGQFEEWFKFHHGEEGSIVTLHRANGGANYADPHVDLAWIAWRDSRAAMLNSEKLNQPVSDSYKLPVTQIKPVADLYGITSPTGSETSFTFDAVEASDFAKGGWSVQEYVELERYQEAMAGNPPVTPDGWREEAERLAELHGCSFVVFRHGEGPQCADPTKVIISFTDKGLGYSDSDNFRENVNSSTNNFRENPDASTNCPKCGGHGTYHCPQMLGTVECECTFPAALRREVSGRIQEERAQIREEMVMGARLTRHRFKP